MAANKKTNNAKYEGMTASKAKRERAKDERAAAKRNAAIRSAIPLLILLAIIALIGAGYARQWYIDKNKTVASTDYSAMLNEDGTIANVNVNDYVKTFDVNSVTIAQADVEYTDEQLEADLQTQLSSFKTVNTDAALTVADGDEVSIDYVGTMDGAEFDGGSAEDYALTIGSGSFIDDFEQQLIGSHPGDQLTVEVTFPDPYDNHPDYAGKDASFAVTVKGIYEMPVFDDAFVQANLSEFAQTADGYRQYMRDTHYQTSLTAAVRQYVTDHISADSYPADYIKHLKSLQMTINEQEYNYMAQMYTAYGMPFEYASPMEYFGASTQAEYEKVLQTSAEGICLRNMAFQDLAAQAGITVSDEDYQTFLTENSVPEDTEQEYGKPYIIQQYILPEKVVSYIGEHATVE